MELYLQFRESAAFCVYIFDASAYLRARRENKNCTGQRGGKIEAGIINAKYRRGNDASSGERAVRRESTHDSARVPAENLFVSCLDDK